MLSAAARKDTFCQIQTLLPGHFFILFYFFLLTELGGKGLGFVFFSAIAQCDGFFKVGLWNQPVYVE